MIVEWQTGAGAPQGDPAARGAAPQTNRSRGRAHRCPRRDEGVFDATEDQFGAAERALDSPEDHAQARRERYATRQAHELAERPDGMAELARHVCPRGRTGVQRLDRLLPSLLSLQAVSHHTAHRPAPGQMGHGGLEAVHQHQSALFAHWHLIARALGRPEGAR
jgi:hypothetical protein